TQDCAPPCDLLLDSANAVCISNDSFIVRIGFSGTGNDFVLTDNQGSPSQSGAAGTYTFGPYANNTVVDIFVNDSSKANCDTTVVGLTQDCTPPCDLQLLSAVPNCISNSQFQVVVTFSGTGNGFVLTDNQGSPAQVGAAGTYTFGPYNNNTQVSISLSEPTIPNCDTTVTGLTQDCTPPCDLLLDSANAVCISNDSFIVRIGFSGTGNDFVLTDNQGSPLQSGAAGTYTFGPYANNTVVDIFVNDSSKANCDTTVVGLTQDCTPPCDLQAAAPVVTCLPNGQFNIAVTFTGTGNAFVLNDDQGSSPQSGSAGTYTFGPYASNAIVEIIVTDSSKIGCADTLSGLNASCPQPCSLQVLSVVPNCIGNTNQFEIDINFTGSSNSYRLTDNQGSPAQTGAPGLFTFGPYTSGTVVNLTLTDLDTTSIGCDTTLNGITATCTPVCNFNIDTIWAACFSPDSFYVRLVLDGVNSVYEVNDNLGNSLTGVGPSAVDTLAIGPYFNSTDVFVTIRDTNIANCDTMIGPITADCTPVSPCTLSLDSVTTICTGPDSFCVQVTFSGPPSTYQIRDELFLNFLMVDSAGTYELGCYANNTSVFVRIEDMDRFACQEISGMVTSDCSNPPSNNECSTAESINCNTLVVGSNSKATAGGFSGSCNNLNTGANPGVWYKLIGNGSLITINTCATFPFRNTEITVFKGTCNNLRCVTANDDTPSCPGGPSEVVFLSDPNVEYFVFVSTPAGSEGDFTLRISCNNSKVLDPILEARGLKSFIQLDWSIDMEIDVEGYNIERSEDGTNFTWIGYEECLSGNSLTQRNYEFEDNNVVFNKTYYYRLEQVRKNGDTKYSSVAYASIFTDDDMKLGNLYPNPAKTAFKVDIFANEDGDITLYLVDESGRILQTIGSSLKQGNNTLEVDVSWLRSGVYYVKFNYKGQMESRKLVLIR
ncbi:MAG: T9SS type A sorting domain-containing protein, partial [Bacteroidia bacterium]|nr:T9SS type A sorting domain-containing protein [Bacteroidia bacterium]